MSYYNSFHLCRHFPVDSACIYCLGTSRVCPQPSPKPQYTPSSFSPAHAPFFQQGAPNWDGRVHVIPKQKDWDYEIIANALTTVTLCEAFGRWAIESVQQEFLSRL